jgi:chromatin segregation and condensation protein Rec8/ScpA/Scc1 (kleisin family)
MTKREKKYMGIPVKLQVFEGPLDLLLHLIEKNKIDIYDIPIVEITNQYMEYIREMQKKDLNIMSEFLLMAATLLDIKCKMLLPKEVNEEGEEEDPRQELVEQLLPCLIFSTFRAANIPVKKVITVEIHAVFSDKRSGERSMITPHKQKSHTQ